LGGNPTFLEISVLCTANKLKRFEGEGGYGYKTGTVRISGESPCGEVRALVRFVVRVDWWVDYRASIGGKQYDAPGSYTTAYRLKTSSS
jgi:hypothetical protein